MERPRGRTLLGWFGDLREAAVAGEEGSGRTGDAGTGDGWWKAGKALVELAEERKPAQCLEMTGSRKRSRRWVKKRGPRHGVLGSQGPSWGLG